MIIGITGGIATGKSAVTNYLIEKGYFVLDSDIIAHEAYIKGSNEYFKIIQEFGCVKDDGEIDRSELGKIVFNDKEKLKKLESIIHPYVFNRIDEELKKNNDKLQFVSMALLYEVGYESKVDKVITVTVNETTQILRLMNRDKIDYDYAKVKISNQMPLNDKVVKSDYIVDNNYSLNETYIIVDNILKDLKKMVG